MKKCIAILGAIATGILLFPIAILAGSVLLFVLLIPINMLLNNADLEAFKHSFAALEHPASTESLAMSSRTGNLGCASNHCDYFVGNLRSTRLPRDALIAHYEDVTIPPPDTSFKEPAEIQLWFFDDEIPECTPEVDALFNRPAAWGVDLSTYEGKTLYIAYAEAMGAPPGADIRCH